MITVPEVPGRWRKSSFSAQDTECVEVAYDGAVRDSKNPTAGVLRVPLPGFLAAVKADRLTH